MKPTKQLQQKLEDIFKALEYKVRYEKGNFKSDYCLIEDQNIVVINKFYPLESKINALIEILRNIEPDFEKLDASQTKLVRKISQTELEF
ncbi:MAG: hypothetical protein AAF570_20575 [Bacteroidota bacterium]